MWPAQKTLIKQLPQVHHVGYKEQLILARSWDMSTGPIPIPTMWNGLVWSRFCFIGEKTSQEAAQEIYDNIKMN